MQTIIYVMRHIDIGEHIEIPYKKVGITGAGNSTLDSRLQQISNTKSPIKAQCIAAWEHNDAKQIESAIHLLLDDSRVEGEWFLDKDDTLVERMQPIMQLLGAIEIPIIESSDTYTKNIIKKENATKAKINQTLLGEISELLNSPLRNSMRKGGPTFFSDEKDLTYYTGARKSGNHNLTIGRCKPFFDEIVEFLEDQGYDFEPSTKGDPRIMGVSSETIAEIINLLESSFENIKHT